MFWFLLGFSRQNIQPKYAPPRRTNCTLKWRGGEAAPPICVEYFVLKTWARSNKWNCACRLAAVGLSPILDNIVLSSDPDLNSLMNDHTLSSCPHLPHEAVIEFLQMCVSLYIFLYFFIDVYVYLHIVCMFLYIFFVFWYKIDRLMDGGRPPLISYRFYTKTI